MKRIFIVTGAGGHLGSTIVRKLSETENEIRCLLLEGESGEALNGIPCAIYYGDVTDRLSLNEIFDTPDDAEVYVVHCAGIVSITSKRNPAVYNVNVNGTKNVVDVCHENGVKRLVHVSSVHSIPEKAQGEMITEVSHFDPKLVKGDYAKTKAEATQYVLDRVKEGLDAVVVHPSGIIGPNDYGMSHMTQLIVDVMRGSLTAGVKGGYDFVDVRDVADGVIAAAMDGQKGECYILSNRYVSVPELLQKLCFVLGRKPIRVFLPIWFAKLTAPFAEVYYKLLRQKPLYTRYSLYTLTSNANFSNQKAKSEIGYKTRGISETLRDTAQWLKEFRPAMLKPKHRKRAKKKIGLAEA